MKNGLVIDNDGNKYWYKDNLYHREDGPAIEYIDISKKWFLEGKLHRVDGPAIEYANRNKIWYYQDRYIDCQTQQQFEKIIKLRLFW